MSFGSVCACVLVMHTHTRTQTYTYVQLCHRIHTLSHPYTHPSGSRGMHRVCICGKLRHVLRWPIFCTLSTHSLSDCSARLALWVKGGVVGCTWLVMKGLLWNIQLETTTIQHTHPESERGREIDTERQTETECHSRQPQSTTPDSAAAAAAARHSAYNPLCIKSIMVIVQPITGTDVYLSLLGRDTDRCCTVVGTCSCMPHRYY